MSSPSVGVVSETTCARHRDTPTLLRCGRCGTPICPRCMISTEVGQRCPDCGRGRHLPTFQISPAILLRGLGAGLIAATILSYLWSLVPGFSFWMALLLGFGTGEAVAWATNRKRGRLLMVVGVVAVLAGFLLGFGLFGRGSSAPLLAILINPLLLVGLVGPFGVAALVLAAVIAAVRQRGW